MARHIWKLLGLAGAAVLVVNLLGVNPLGWVADGLWASDDPPAAADTTLLSITKTQDLRAATGEFSVPVYFGTEQNGFLKKIIPDAFDADSGIALYQGSVDAFIDLSGLTEDDLEIDEAANTLTITVPDPTLSTPRLDHEKSSVVSQDRGVLTRLGEAFSESPMEGRDKLDETAVNELAKAAAQSNLLDTARTNGEDFLVALGEQLGFDRVIIVFEKPSNP
ncbi:MAG TPA: DUF4230 domain-containing protein [Microthrixaceae bacterium]|nr:DUF4230 domain-containing protein [Microthrixaceae bacterium]